MSAGGLLLRAQLRTRWRRQLLLAASLATGLLGFFLVAMLLEGTQQGIVQPLHDTLTGDVRVTWDSDEIAGGRTLEDHRGPAARIRTLGASVAPRLETSQVTVRQDRPQNWTGGLLVGMDVSLAVERESLEPYLVWGTSLPAGSLIDPATGRAYVPLVVGDAAARRLQLSRNASGAPDFGQVLVVTSGRFTQPADPRPLTVEGIVVGVFATGIDSMDRFMAFAPIEETRRLVGDRPGDPTANALVVRGADAAAVEGLALGPEAHVQGARAFAEGLMGSFLLMLEVSGAMAVLLVLGVMGVWLAHEVGTVLARDAAVVGALRAVGIPFGAILQAYGAVVTLVVGSALAAALAAAVAVMALAPPIHVATDTLDLDIGWPLQAGPVLLALAACVALTSLGILMAARRLAAIDVADALRP